MKIFGQECVTIETNMFVSTMVDEIKLFFSGSSAHFQPASPERILQ